MVGLTVTVATVHCVERRNWFSAWLVLFVIALVIVTLRARMYALQGASRIIRLKERERIGELTEKQLIGHRFASDGEIAALVRETLDKNLWCRDIKKAIKSWRPDYFRV